MVAYSFQWSFSSSTYVQIVFDFRIADSCFKGIYFCIAVYGENAFWAQIRFFLLQYLESPQGLFFFFLK